MKAFYAFVVLLLCITAVPGMAAGKADRGAKSETARKAPEPTQEGIAAWADNYYKKYEPTLKGSSKETIDSIKTAFFMNKGVQYFMDDTISKLVTELTISLSAGQPFDVMVSASALLVNTAPKNPRVINLFGIVLNAAGKSEEALPVFEYGVSLRPKNPLLRLNLANAYMDAGKDEKAKTILDKLSFENPNDCATWRALATYWYKHKDMAQFRVCLFKAAKFKGFAKAKADKKKKKVDDNAAQGDESPGQLEPKLKELATSEPFTSADILEEDYPSEAQQIRDKYCKLQGDEKWTLPKLPVCNTTTPKEYAESRPILDEWSSVFASKYGAWCELKGAKMGVDPGASDKVKEAQAQKAAEAQVAAAMKSAQEMLKYAKNMPGMEGVKNKKELNDALKELQKAAKTQGVKLPKVAPKGSNDDSGDASGDQESQDMTKVPFLDSGSPWAQINYRNYSEIQRTYSIYFLKYFKEYNAKVQDIYTVYSAKVKEENDRYDPESAALTREHQKPSNPHGDKDIPCRAAELRHKQLLNVIALNYYHQWINLYMPQYAQKMKPNLDAYWNVCMIYVRSMTDPKIMEREFDTVKSTYLLNASMAGPAITGGGGFVYYPETDEEQRQLDIDIATSRDEAEQKKPQFARDFQSPEFDFSKWMEDHFVVEIAGQFFALKVTAKTIQFDANALIFGGSLKYNPVDNIFESSSSVALKANIGLNICGVGGELKEKVELYKRTATWDLDNNTYKETTGASGEGKLKIGPVTAGSKWELDAELNAKTTAKITLGDISVQDQAKFK